MEHSVKFEYKVYKLSVVVNVLHTAEFGHFTSFTVVVLQRTGKEMYMYNNCYAPAKPLSRSLKLLFSNVPVANAVAFFLNSLLVLDLRREEELTTE